MPSWNEIWAYIRASRKYVALYAITAGIFTLTMYLSGQDMLYVRYALALTAFIAAFTFVICGISYVRRLQKLRASVLASDLPRLRDAIEAEYARLIIESENERIAATRNAEAAHEDNLNYYTLWIHQIKTPIAALRLSLPKDDELVLGELIKIERYADMALQYVKLSDISTDLIIESCDLNDIARQAVKKYALLFVKKKLSVSIEPLKSDVLTDAKWLRFILEQLISNAVKYTKTGGVSIYMNGNALIVEDTGIGIMPADLPRIFEKGFTGMNGRADARASGIGLYLSRRAADALSITLTAESEVGKGSRFTLAFPETNLTET